MVEKRRSQFSMQSGQVSFNQELASAAVEMATLPKKMMRKKAAPKNIFSVDVAESNLPTTQHCSFINRW